MKQVILKDGIKVTTKYPMYVDDVPYSPEDYYANSDGDGGSDDELVSGDDTQFSEWRGRGGRGGGRAKRQAKKEARRERRRSRHKRGQDESQGDVDSSQEGSKESDFDGYSNAFGDKATSLIDKAQKGVDTVKGSGIIELGKSVESLFKSGKSKDSTVAPPTVVDITHKKEEAGMNKTLKYGLIAVAVGVVLYVVSKQLKKK